MLDIKVTIEGDKVIIQNLEHIAGAIPSAIQRGIARAATGVFRRAQYFLHGSGGASRQVRTDYAGFTKKTGEKVIFRSYSGAGAYPVPTRTAGLLNALDWLYPGSSKTGKDGKIYAAQPNEAMVYDSALYANVIHEGLGSSAKYGPRRYLTDALEQFNQGARIVQIIEEEIAKETGHA